MDRNRGLGEVRNEKISEPALHWAKKFILYHGKRHPATMGKAEAEAFLTHLATDLHCSPSTQNQAFNALLFLYREVLRMDFGQLDDVTRAKPMFDGGSVKMHPCLTRPDCDLSRL